MTDAPAVWSEHVVTVDDALMLGVYLGEECHSITDLHELDDVFFVLEARAQDPEPYTVARAGIALRLEELEAEEAARVRWVVTP